MKNDEKEQRTVSNHEEERSSFEKKQSSVCVEESTTKVPVIAESKDDSLQFSKVQLQKESLVQVEEVKWRPKTRVKNKLALNMKNILNPKLRNEKVMVIEDSSNEEYMESEQELNSQQVYTKEEHSRLLNSSPGIDKVSEEPKVSALNEVCLQRFLWYKKQLKIKKKMTSF